MQSFVEVGTALYKQDLYQKLADLQVKDGLPIEVVELQQAPHFMVRCSYPSHQPAADRGTTRIYQYYFARALAEMILASWEGTNIRKILKQEYDFSEQEIEAIVNKTWLKRNHEPYGYFTQARQQALVKSILEYLDQHLRMDIEGFMTFRAVPYKRELKKQLAQAVNDYTLGQEHLDFIDMLKRFLESQHTIFPKLQLVIREGEVGLFDEEGRNLNPLCFEESLMVSEENGTETYDDFLITAIVKCAPGHLVVHTKTDFCGQVIQMMQEVFEDKMSFCNGCSLCGREN